MDLHYHLKGKAKALKSTGAEIMVAQNTKSNLTHEAIGPSAHRDRISMKNWESMNLRKVWEIKGNTKKSREILGYFSSIC